MSMIEQIVGTLLIALLFWFDYKLVKHTINPSLKELDNDNSKNSNNDMDTNK